MLGRSRQGGYNLPVRLSFAILSLFVFISCSRVEERGYFVCDFLGSPSKRKPPKKKFDEFSYFDRVFYYKKTSDGQYKTNFSIYGGTSTGFQRDKDTLSEAYLSTAREQQGFYREIFHVYRIHLKTRVLIHSYVYYLNPKDYETNFWDFESRVYNNPLLFDLIQREAPKDYVKIGWDKSVWQCYEVSYPRYLYFRIQNILSSIIAGIS